MSTARARDPPRPDLPFLGDVPPQLVRVLVVDLGDFLLAEVTVPLADRPSGTRTLAPLLLPFVVSSVWHAVRTGCRRPRRRRSPHPLQRLPPPERIAAHRHRR